jgi:uncharacterized HAD superfamily protein
MAANPLPIIAVDIDDVLADNAQGLIEFSNERWGTDLSVEDYTEHWAQMWQIDNTETETRANELHESGAIGKYRHNDSALPVLRDLAQRFRLVIITSRRLQVEKETRAWIADHYPDIFSEIHFAGIWDTIDDGSHLRTKAGICQSLGVNYLIDDQLKHCAAAAERGIQSLLFGNYSWNQSDVLPNNVVRVNDWNGIQRHFSKDQ